MQAKDVMTEGVVCLHVSASIFDAAELMVGAGVSAVPVIDGKGRRRRHRERSRSHATRRDRHDGQEIVAVAIPRQRRRQRPTSSCSHIRDAWPR